MRLFVLALVLANGLYFGWSHGSFRAFGFAPPTQTEPQRMAQQIRPESLRLVSNAEAKRLEEQAIADAAPKECLVAGYFDAAQTTALRRALEASLPAGSWHLEEVQVQPRWIIYMGKYPDADAMSKKRAELVALGLHLDALNNASLEPGLSLGGFDTPLAAQHELARLSQKGLRTARVVQERAAMAANQLRLPAVSESLKTKLGEVKAALAGKPLRACQEPGH